MESVLALNRGRVVTPTQVFDPGTVVVRGPHIEAVGRTGTVTLPPGADVLDLAGMIICPGFIELHTHGYGGIDLGKVASSPESPTGTIHGDVLAMARRLPSTGVSSFLPTLLGATGWDEMLAELREVAQAAEDQAEGARILGIHMEGPYFNPAPKGPYDRWPPGGSVPPALVRRPSLPELHAFLEASRGRLRMMSLSPEIEGALDLIRELDRRGVVASGAHSFASYREVLAAVDLGMRTVTHLYNGMRHQDHREPGIIEAALTCDAITAQIVCDGVHVHLPALEVAFRCKGGSRLAITTDNTAYAGMPNGTYVDLAGRQIEKTDDMATIGEGRLFGSVMPLNRQLRTLAYGLKLPLATALRMATLTPARLLGIDHTTGSLAPGKDADVVAMDADFRVMLTLCRGQIAYRDGAQQ